jgi:uridine phosphorylase
VAERVLVPGDPARAMRLATALTDQPLMLNHARGLWGYTGRTPDGESLTVQSTGLGGPSAAAVVCDLAALGARRLMRVGTCRSDTLAAGTAVAAQRVLGEDGTSRALGADLEPGLVADLPGVTVASFDLPSGPLPAGAHVRDMTTAAVLAAAAVVGLAAGAVLVVVDDSLDEEELHAAELSAGRAALATFSKA